MPELTEKHTVFDSIEQLLAAETLSRLLARPVTRVNCVPMNGHNGLAGSQLSYVETDTGRLVLKQMSITTDYLMYASGDLQCRAVKLWQYGLLDELAPHLEHSILAATRDGDGWAILMADLTGQVFQWGQPFPPARLPGFLEALARLHATFWNDPRLEAAQLGLNHTAWLLNFLSIARDQTGDSLSVLPAWIRNGWATLPELLAPQVYDPINRLMEHPEPLLKAVSRYPSTLLHADFRKENLADNGRPIFLDWQSAASSLMIIDLAWFTKHGDIQDAMPMGEALNYYRERLEAHLGQRFAEHDWQAMVALGYAVDALRWLCIAAHFYQADEKPESRAWMKNSVELHAARVMEALPLIQP